MTEQLEQTDALTVQTLIDLAVEEGLAPSNYFVQWHEYSAWQMQALLDVGLEPHHRLLDVGCGAGRLGVRAIPYLDDGHYHGVDAFEPFLRVAHRVLDRVGVDKRYTLIQSSTFEFDRFGATFDFAMAQSVFTHLSGPQVEACMTALKRVMSPGGTLLFTYFPKPKARGSLYAQVVPMVHAGHPPERLAELAAKHELGFEANAMEHPGQRVGRFTF